MKYGIINNKLFLKEIRDDRYYKMNRMVNVLIKL